MFSPWKLYQVGQQIWCMRRGEGGMLGRKGGEAIITKQYWICHCQKIHLMNVLFFCLELGRTNVEWEPPWPWEVGSCTRWQPERTAPLNLAPGSEKEATDTFMHKCLLHAFNGCGPDGFFLLMHYQWELLSASRLQHLQTGLYHLFPSSVLLST